LLYINLKLRMASFSLRSRIWSGVLCTGNSLGFGTELLKRLIWLVWEQMQFLSSLFHSCRGERSACQPGNQRWGFFMRVMKGFFSCSSLNQLNRLCCGDLCILQHNKLLIFAVRGFWMGFWGIIGTALTSCSDKIRYEHTNTCQV